MAGKASRARYRLVDLSDPMSASALAFEWPLPDWNIVADQPNTVDAGDQRVGWPGVRTFHGPFAEAAQASSLFFNGDSIETEGYHRPPTVVEFSNSYIGGGNHLPKTTSSSTLVLACAATTCRWVPSVNSLPSDGGCWSRRWPARSPAGLAQSCVLGAAGPSHASNRPQT